MVSSADSDLQLHNGMLSVEKRLKKKTILLINMNFHENKDVTVDAVRLVIRKMSMLS